MAERRGAVVGRLGVWWRAPPRSPDGRGGAVGRLGHAAWADPAVGAALLDAACAQLAAEGCTRAVGPLDGSTWHAYRVVTDGAPGGVAEPPFALEPAPPAAVAEAFGAAGFAPVARYVSTRLDALADESAALRADLARLGRGGIVLRPFHAGDADAEFRRLHPVLLRAFAQNPYFAPISFPAFLALYRPLLARADPGLVVLAERGGTLVGVVLGLPDLAQAGRGDVLDTVVVKTLAVAPEARGVGLGGVLVRAVHEAARGRGMTRAVHALMHEGNRSVGVSAQHPGRVIRRYALLGRDLPAPPRTAPPAP